MLIRFRHFHQNHLRLCYIGAPVVLTALYTFQIRRESSTEMSYSTKKEDYQKFLTRSDNFFKNVRRPTQENFTSRLEGTEQEEIVSFANAAYPIIHEKVVIQAKKFLEHKQHNGNSEEMKFYKDMDVPDFIDRLIKKRPLAFLGADDYWMDKQGNKRTANNNWDSLARKHRKSFLTYEEMKISALIQLSTETFLINSGDRYNIGIKGAEGSFIKRGVYVAAVGARFEKPGKMDYEDFVLPYDSRIQGIEIPGHRKFDCEKYKDRMKISFETFLLEANQRGKLQNKKVYCHVVGLGLGVWQLWPGQTEYWLQAFEESIDTLVKKGQINHITDIDFSRIESSRSRAFNHGEPQVQKFLNSNILIHFSKRNPFEVLDADKLVVAMFAWDGNSYIGNEYWMGMLSDSGDPAAASCSFIPELLNPDINPAIDGHNLHVASLDNGIMSYTDFKDLSSQRVSQDDMEGTQQLEKIDENGLGQDNQDNQDNPKMCSDQGVSHDVMANTMEGTEQSCRWLGDFLPCWRGLKNVNQHGQDTFAIGQDNKKRDRKISKEVGLGVPSKRPYR